MSEDLRRREDARQVVVAIRARWGDPVPVYDADFDDPESYTVGGAFCLYLDERRGVEDPEPERRFPTVEDLVRELSAENPFLSVGKAFAFATLINYAAERGHADDAFDVLVDALAFGGPTL